MAACPKCHSHDFVKNGAGRIKCRGCGKSSNSDELSEKAMGIKLKPAPKAGRVHFMIPDTQIRKGVPTDHVSWIAEYIREKRPDVVVQIGDWWDMPSLSMHDPIGSLAMEGARYEDDIEAGNAAMIALSTPLKGLGIELHLTLGNHEERILRDVNRDPRYAGTIGMHHLNAARLGWTVHEFREIVNVDGVWYSHFFYNPLTGRPWGGTIDNRLNKIGHSFTAGHEQTMRYTSRYLANGQEQHGLVAGACYLHDESYKGPQGNHHWRGLIVKHEVRNGVYDLMRVSLDFLCRRYERVGLAEFMAKKYPKHGYSLAS